ncbi:hypothetical protein AVEN_176095-1 [Araneus ventricosus]|uniref:Uncharacterized protein n=1 Tax=Araneus ventricosus TaxID=182803 RepID=A0A4Y2SLJ9_ARAVE|nr:hypothetical protein AVEN_176095-1 [Araneus ventricosus]
MYRNITYLIPFSGLRHGVTEKHELEEEGYGLYPPSGLLTSIIQKVENRLRLRNKLVAVIELSNGGVDRFLPSETQMSASFLCKSSMSATYSHIWKSNHTFA